MPESSKHLLQNELASAWPVESWRDVTVLAAVSGGADSVALLRALHEQTRRPGPPATQPAKRSAALSSKALSTPASSSSPELAAGTLLVAHVNHRLRGDESDRDEAFVVQLAQALGLEALVARLDPASRTIGSEEQARQARYDQLVRLAETRGARYIAVAHTADDQAETILHHVLRGTGLAGLAGMPRFRVLSPAVTLVRPLLGASRQGLRDYLSELGQPYREDSTNVDPRFTRNRLRHELLPQLARDYNPTVVDALLRLGRLAAESREVIDACLTPLVDRAVRRQDSADAQVVRISVASLGAVSPAVDRELLIRAWNDAGWPMGEMSLTRWEELADLLRGPAPRKAMFPGAISAERTAGELLLQRSLSPR